MEFHFIVLLGVLFSSSQYALSDVYEDSRLMEGRRVSEVKCYEYTLRFRRWEDREQKKDDYYGFLFGSDDGGLPGPGGDDAKIAEFPHMGALGWSTQKGSWNFKCGGSLISERFVVTAAHCSQVPKSDTSVADPKPKIVRFGTIVIQDYYGRKRTETIAYDVRIQRFIPYERYKAPQLYYDIALVELDEEVNFRWEVLPACLWTKFENPETGSWTGWGVIDVATGEIPPILQKGVVHLLEFDECEKMLEMKHNRNWRGFQSHQLCAGEKAGGVDTCQGDSGGPLQTLLHPPDWPDSYLYHIVGVTSFGFGCGKPETPGVYTRIASFLDWIESTVWPNSTVQNGRIIEESDSETRVGSPALPPLPPLPPLPSPQPPLDETSPNPTSDVERPHTYIPIIVAFYLFGQIIL